MRKIQQWIDNGVHIDASNIKKETALFICSINGHAKCVEFLLSRGADPNKLVLLLLFHDCAFVVFLYTDIEATRPSFEISHTRTDLTA